MRSVPFEVTILGSGTSHGVPVPGCTCPVCRSSDPRDSRTRASVWIRSAETSVVIDAGPEFRLQAVRERIPRLDALLVTHAHADHIHGLDDVRAYCKDRPLPVYAAPADSREITERFSYAFKETPQMGGGKPSLVLRDTVPYESFVVGDLVFVPLLGDHGVIPVTGFRVGDFAYLTDVSAIPERTFEALSGLSVLVLDGLRNRPHPTHFSIPEAILAAERIGARKTWLTHLCHEVSHAEAELLCSHTSGRVSPAYDSLTFSGTCPLA